MIAGPASPIAWRSTTRTALSVLLCSMSFRPAKRSVAPITAWPWTTGPGRCWRSRKPLPERLISADPEIVVDDALGGWGSDRVNFPPQVRVAYIEALRDPDAVHAICEEYRAAATIDFAQDEKDRSAGRKISCPALILWSEGSGLDSWYKNAGGPLGIWRDWATDVTGRAISGGHFFPEQNSVETISELRPFFTSS
jgi:haloacetate dehalogenase